MLLFFRTGTVLLAGLIAYISLIPAGGGGSFPHADKVMHFLAYGALAGGLGLGWPRLGLRRVVLYAFLFGAMVEVAQWLAPTGRTASLFDMIANGTGALLAAYVLSLIRRRFPVT